MSMQIADESFQRIADAGDNAFAHDAKLSVKFYRGAIKNDDASSSQGRPIFEDIEMVRIAVPGERDYVCRPITELDKQRFPRLYEAFQKGSAETMAGTPLTAWPAIQASQVAELQAVHVHTVEQLSGMSDVTCQRFQALVSLRQRARDFLEAAKGSAHLTQMRSELEKRDGEIESLKSQMAELMKRSQDEKSEKASGKR